MAQRVEMLMHPVYDHSPSSEEICALRDELGNIAAFEEADATFGPEVRRAEIDAEHAKVSWYEQLFQETRAARLAGDPEPDVDWSLIAHRINKRFKYKPALSAFVPERYVSYEDWFLRKLSDETRQACLSHAAVAEVCAPVQGKLWPQVLSGEITLKVSVIAVEELLQLLQGNTLLQLRLRWPDYHRVHSPVDGTIVSIRGYEKDELFPGAVVWLL